MRLLSRKARKAAEEFPFLAKEAQKGHGRPAGGGESGGGVDACAEPTANLLAALFKELAGCNEMQAAALERFGYFLGRWVYLMDAADDLMEDLAEDAFNPFIPGWGSLGKSALPRGAQGGG